MKTLEQNIYEALGIKKSFILNMKEIDYDKLLSFISDMKDKQEKCIVINIEDSTEITTITLTKRIIAC